MKLLRNKNCTLFYSLKALLVLLFLLFNFPHSARASLAEDLIAREGWKKISLDFERADLLNILKLFSQQSGLNFVASPTVSGKRVTLYMENVPLREALEKILNANKLTYELDEDSNIFIVKELIRPEVDLVTKVFNLKYARVRNSPLNLATRRGTSGGISGGTSGGISGGTSGGTVIHTGLVDTIEQLLSTYGEMSEDSRTNSLIITDVPYAFEAIELAIKQLDVPIPQVIIEVEILDTSKSLIDDIGFNWGDAGSLFTFALPSHKFPSSSIFDSGGSNPGSLFFGGPSGGNALILKHLKSQADTKVLARPKILTLSNETATITIAGDDVIGTVQNLDINSVVTSVTPERALIGVVLTVTPSVNIETGEITMVLAPSVTSSEVSGFKDAQGNEFNNPQERSAQVTVVAKNNQTIVLGGLLRQDFSETRTKVAFFGDIPFLGALFRRRNMPTNKDREMLVFITPRIVDSSGADYVQSAQLGTSYNHEILARREQAGYSYRKEEIDKELRTWDN